MKIFEILKKKRENVSISFDQIVEKWLEYKKMNIKKSSYSNYEYSINKYLMPYLQGKRMVELEKYDFNYHSTFDGILLASKQTYTYLHQLQTYCHLKKLY